MNLVEWLQRLLTNFGAAWVMWLLLGLSVISVAVMLERAWFYHSLKDDTERLGAQLRERLRANDYSGAQEVLRSSPSAEAAVVLSGLLEADLGPESAGEAMSGARALQRLKLERRLTFLGTLGNNAPFVGLLGTVIGVVEAFELLGSQQQTVAQTAQGMAPEQVMSAIAEALVATAVGLFVAIPAVAMYNVFQRRLKSILAHTEALGSVLLAHLVSKPQPAAADAE